jgi:hypothetical protein
MLGMDIPLVRFGRWIAAVMFLLAAVLTAVILGGNVLKARDSIHWPTATGTIGEARVQPTADREGSYDVIVSYSYTSADGAGHVGTKVRMGYGPYGKDEAEAMIAGLSPGQKHVVYYDSSDAEQAVLVPGAGRGEYLQLIVPPLMLGVGILIIIWLLKTRPATGDRLFPNDPPPLPR